jgi:nucleolar protein 9
MPKENRKRGRRDEQKKRKRDSLDQDPEPKRRKNRDVEAVDNQESPVAEHANLAGPYQDADGVTHPGAMPFFGMLDEDEQEYFKKADQLLELNQFDSPEDRSQFLESVYREAEGKELKIANSQSCSRLMERLILLSTPSQLKNLFKKFSGQ